jgi:exosortase
MSEPGPAKGDFFGKLRGLVRSSPVEVVGVVGAAAALLWVYWPTLCDLARRWGHDAQYSHGYLVPLFALYLLWARRGLAPDAFAPRWWGLLLLLAALALRLGGTALFLPWLAEASLLPCLAGLFALAGGWRALRWAWPAIAFLVFMVPLPYRLEVALAHPLQRIATLASTYALQTLGLGACADGNVIRMGEVRMGVVEACSGLAMLVIFFALSTAVALVVRRPLLDKVLIFLSAVPIALISNVVRITATGVLHRTAGSYLANLVFHDLAGWLMMPLALGLLWLELRLLAVVLVTPRPRVQAGFAFPAGHAVPGVPGPRPASGPKPARSSGRRPGGRITPR